MTFHEHLIHLRKQRGLSQEQLGEKIGVSRQTVSKWELGDTTPELEKLVLLSDYFNISVDRLVGREAENASDLSCSNCPRTWHYEYKSKRQLFGLPLIHVNLGPGIRRAKGVIAVGTIAKGIISLGAVSVGVLSLGGLSLGLFSLGGISLAMLLSVGGLSAGTVSFGGLSIGILAFGGCAIGVYSIGGCAVAARVAAGGLARAPIAIGDKAMGQITFDIHNMPGGQEVYNSILSKFPGTLKFIAEIFSSVFY